MNDGKKAGELIFRPLVRADAKFSRRYGYENFLLPRFFKKDLAKNFLKRHLLNHYAVRLIRFIEIDDALYLLIDSPPTFLRIHLAESGFRSCKDRERPIVAPLLLGNRRINSQTHKLILPPDTDTIQHLRLNRLLRQRDRVVLILRFKRIRPQLPPQLLQPLDRPKLLPDGYLLPVLHHNRFVEPRHKLLFLLELSDQGE